MSRVTNRQAWLTARRAPVGLACAAAGFALLSAQDMFVKMTIAHLPVAETLCLRSLVVFAACAATGGRPLIRTAARSSERMTLTLRAVFGVAAWTCYFSAAATMPIANLAAVFLTAPLIVAVMAPVLLGERSRVPVWIAAALGLAGEMVATKPLGQDTAAGFGLAFAAAALWAASLMVGRHVARTQSPLVQMAYLNALFIMVGAAATGRGWMAPDASAAAAILAAGLLGSLGQFALFHALSCVPATSVAILQYTSLFWAMLFGLVGLGELPGPPELAGAALVALSGLTLWLASARTRPAIATPCLHHTRA